MHLELALLPGEYAVCKLPELPAFSWDDDFVSLTRTSDEFSLVCTAHRAPGNGTNELGWRILRIEGQLDFSLVGIMAEVSGLLAAAGISIFAISTYNTDYIMVKHAQLAGAIRQLRDAGHLVTE